MALQNSMHNRLSSTGADKQIEDNIHDAEEAQIVRALSEIRYIFQQALLHEAVYDMQLRSRLKELHLDTAKAIELVYADKLDNHYDELAYHYAKTDERNRAAEYMLLAAHQARRAYQNDYALELYNQLLGSWLEPDDPNRLVVLVYLGDVYELLGRWEEAALCYDKALALDLSNLETRFLNRARSERGYIALLQGDYDSARSYLNQAVALMEQSDDVFGQFKVHAHLGALHFRLGLYEQAQNYFERGLQIGADYAHTATAADSAAYLGLTHMNLGRYEHALETMSHQLTFCRSAGNRHGIAALQTNLGIVYTDLGYEAEAMASFEEGLELARLLGDKRLSSINLGCLGIVHQLRSEYDRAFQLFDQDLRLCQEMGDPQGIAICYGLLGALAAQQGQLTEATKLQKKALKGCKNIGYLKGVAKARCEIAATYVLSNKPDKAILQYNKAIAICRDLGQRPLLMQSLIEKSISLLELGVYFELPDMLREARTLYDASNRPAMRFPLLWAEAWWQSVSLKNTEYLKLLEVGSLAEKADAAWAIWCAEPTNEHLAQFIDAGTAAYTARPAYRIKRRLDIREALHKN
jgi:tetratricopeptide (TPR) repeat protein